MKAIRIFFKILACLSFATGLAILVWRLVTGSYEPFEYYDASIFFIWAFICMFESLLIKQEKKIEQLEDKVWQLKSDNRSSRSLLNYVVEILDSRTRKKE